MKKKQMQFLVDSAEWQNNTLQFLVDQANTGRTVNPTTPPPPTPPNG